MKLYLLAAGFLFSSMFASQVTVECEKPSFSGSLSISKTNLDRVYLCLEQAAWYTPVAICLIRLNKTKTLTFLPGLVHIKNKFIGGEVKTKRFGVTLQDTIVLKNEDGSTTAKPIIDIFVEWQSQNPDKGAEDFAKYFESKYPNYKLILEEHVQRSNTPTDKVLELAKNLGVTIDLISPILTYKVLDLYSKKIKTDIQSLWKRVVNA